MLCGLKYKFQYIDELPKVFKSSALIFGSAFHSSLSWLFKEELRGNRVTLEMLYKVFDSDWYAQKIGNNIQYKPGETEPALMNLGKEFLRLFYAEPRRPIRGSEIPFTVPLLDQTTGEDLGVTLDGFFDLIEVDGTIVDFKTSAQTMTQGDIDYQIQLSAYGFAFQLLHGVQAKGYKIVNFVKSRKPKMITFDTKRSQKDFEGFFYLAKEVLKGIKASVFYPHPGYWCRDCEYAFICPIWEEKVGFPKLEPSGQSV